MDISKYKIEWLFLLLGVILAAISYYCDTQSIKDTTWFARSGAIVVLFSAIVEYRLSQYIYEDVLQAAIKTARINAVLPFNEDSIAGGLIKANQTTKPESPKPRLILKRVSHALIIIGTIIWGYGDILIN